MTGGDEDNIFITDAGDDVLNGGAGDDRLSAWIGNDEVYAGAGNDTIINTGGEDLFDGGSGVDTLITDLSQSVKDRLGLSLDFDIVFDLTAEDPHMRHYAVTPDGTDYAWDEIYSIENYTLIGDFDVTLTGDDQANILVSDSGDDVLRGGAGNDTLDGGSGDDKLYGGAGNDTLIHSGSGAQLFDGGDGIDTYKKSAVQAGLSLEIEVNLETGYTGSVTDRDHPLQDIVTNIENVDFSLVDWDLSLIGDSSDNILTAGSGDDTLYGGAGDDTLDGGAGDDTINDGAGTDIINGGDGTDTLLRNLSDDYSDYAFTPIIDLNSGKFYAEEYPDDYDTLISMENLQVAGNFNYTLKGDNADNILTAGAGNDTLDGGDGDDKLDGGAGDDVLNGGAGDDVLNGDAGNDIIRAGAGNDTIINGSGYNYNYTGGGGEDVYDGGAGIDTLITGMISGSWHGDYIDEINLTTGSAGGLGSDFHRDELLNIENVTYVGALDTQIVGDGGANELTGSTGVDTIDGRAGADTLSGGDGNDTIYGGEGNDRLEGAGGNDTLTGGSGSDTFQFHGVFEHDTITDYDSDEDILEFYANDGSALNISDLIETVNSDGNRVLSTADGLSSVTLESTAVDGTRPTVTSFTTTTDLQALTVLVQRLSSLRRQVRLLAKAVQSQQRLVLVGQLLLLPMLQVRV